MALSVETGYDLEISLDGIVLGCAQTCSFGGTVEDKDATCTASKGTKESVPGQKSYSLSADGLMRVATGADIATNVTYKTLEDYFEARQIFDFTFGTSTTGATKKKGKAYVKSYTESGGGTNDAKFAVTFTVTGEVTYDVNP